MTVKKASNRPLAKKRPWNAANPTLLLRLCNTKNNLFGKWNKPASPHSGVESSRESGGSSLGEVAEIVYGLRQAQLGEAVLPKTRSAYRAGASRYETCRDSEPDKGPSRVPQASYRAISPPRTSYEPIKRNSFVPEPPQSSFHFLHIERPVS